MNELKPADCKFCNRLVSPEEDGWGVAYDVATEETYIYHLECLEQETE